MKIYLIGGKARNGKDTLANFIVDYYEKNNKKVVKTGYSKYIKMFAKELTDWDGSEETKANYRSFLQELGTQIIRQKMNKFDFFVKRMAEDIEVYSHYVDAVIISDVRFPIEIDYIKERFNDVHSIRVIRPDFASELNKKELAHETEVDLSDDGVYDEVIINTTLDKLERDTIKLIERIDNNEEYNK